MRKVYLASSWKLAKRVREVAFMLRDDGHEVFDFTDVERRPEGLPHFVFDASQWTGKPLKEIGWLEFLEYEATQHAFKCDKAGLDWSDTVIVILPCGRSAHLEAGYAAGQGKDVYFFGDLQPGEFEVMYLLAKGCYASHEYLKLRERLEHPVLDERWNQLMEAAERQMKFTLSLAPPERRRPCPWCPPGIDMLHHDKDDLSDERYVCPKCGYGQCPRCKSGMSGGPIRYSCKCQTEGK